MRAGGGWFSGTRICCRSCRGRRTCYLLQRRWCPRRPSLDRSLFAALDGVAVLQRPGGLAAEGLLGFERPVGLAEELARDEDDIGVAAGDDFVCVLGLGDEANGAGADLRLLANPP